MIEGACLCGAVRFEVETDFPELTMCDCSICRKKNALMVKVHESKFKLLAGEESLTEYQFNTGTAKHLFCTVCGIKSFYVPRSNPDGFDVNVRCLDNPPKDLVIEPFDGRDWEKHGAGLAHLSKE